MNLLLQLLVAAGLIAVMIVVRMIADRRVLQQRLSCAHAGEKPDGAACSHGCSKQN